MSESGRAASTADTDLLARLERNFAATVSRGRDAMAVGPFRAFLAPNSTDYYLSAAMPVETPADWAPAIEALNAAFEQHDRIPRLEFFSERFPTLAEALETAWYTREMTAPVMVLEADGFRPHRIEGPARFKLLEASDTATLDAYLAMQSAAYGMAFGEGDNGWRPLLAAGLADGSILAGATWLNGRPVSGASLAIGADSAELAGVGTLPTHRRRGLAADACSRLLEAYFAAGGELCWLSAGEEAGDLYTRLGFRTVGTQLNYGRGSTRSPG